MKDPSACAGRSVGLAVGTMLLLHSGAQNTFALLPLWEETVMGHISHCEGGVAQVQGRMETTTTSSQ